ncbi:hypothetical protein ACFY94_13130 [Streptomyces griseorubiginosus]|uniref:hypothetical protein n=1 Tax=Streptomyces griseorubiginosus TaxID=67304 RepID=UPI0036E3C031
MAGGSGGADVLADDFTVAAAPARSVLQRAHWLDYGQAIPTSPWRSADTFPRQLSLKTVGGIQLVQGRSAS